MEQNERARERPSEAAQDEILASIMQKIGGASAVNAAGKVGTEDISASGSVNSVNTNPLGDIFSSLLSNPELISKLPVIISSVKPIIEMLGKVSSGGGATVRPDASDTSVKGDAEEAVSAARIKDIPLSHKGSDSRTALLCAMKPYLSNDRQNAVDYIVKLSRLGEILKTL